MTLSIELDIQTNSPTLAAALESSGLPVVLHDDAAAKSIDNAATFDEEAAIEAAVNELLTTAAQPKATLRDLMFDALRLDAILSMNGGELTPELEPIADRIAAKLLSKVDGTVDYLDTLDQYAARLRAEEVRLQKIRQQVAARVERYEHYLLRCMEMRQHDKLAGDFHELAVRLNPPKLVLSDTAVIPETYRSTEVIPEQRIEHIDEDRIKADLLAREKALAAVEKAKVKMAKAKVVDATIDIDVPDDVPGARLERATRLHWK